MTPFEQARAVYDQEPCARTFEQDLCFHLFYGYVISTPKLFLMGRPVHHEAPADEIVDPSYEFKHPDAWLVYLVSGDLTCVPKFMPYYLKWVGWQRKNVLRFYKTQSVIAKLRNYDSEFSNGFTNALPQGSLVTVSTPAPVTSITYSRSGQC